MDTNYEFVWNAIEREWQIFGTGVVYEMVREPWKKHYGEAKLSILSFGDVTFEQNRIWVGIWEVMKPK